MTHSFQSNYKWVVLAVVTFGQATISFGSLSIPPLSGDIVNEFNLSKTEFGAIMAALYLGAVIASYPFGRLSDNYSVKKILSLSMMVTGILVASLYLVRNYAVMVIAVFLMGLLAYGAANPVTNKAIMGWFPQLNRGTAMGIKQCSVPLGGMLSAIVFSQLALHYGWRHAFMMGGIMIILTAIIPMIYYKEPPKPPVNDMITMIAISSDNDTSPMYPRFRKEIIFISLIAGCLAMVQIAVGTYVVLYLKEVAFFSVALAGTCLGLTNAGGIVGRISWGLISDHIFKGKRNIVLQIIACIIGFITIVLSRYSYTNTNIGKWILVLIIFVLGFTAFGWNGIFHAYLVELAGLKQAGTVTGISMSIVFCGNILGPLIFGAIVDMSGGSYRYSWEFISALMVLSVIFLFLLKVKLMKKGQIG